MTYGIGLIGCGLIGRKRALSIPNNSRLVGIFDVVAQRATNLAEALGEPNLVFTSASEVIEAADVNYVIVATSHDQLAPIGLKVLEAGKHLLIEKPGANGTSQLQLLLNESNRHGNVVRVGFNHRFHPAFIMCKELVESGKYGKPLWIRGRYGHGGRLGYEKEWRAKREISGGGELLDQGSHLLDLSRYIAGDLSLSYSSLKTLFWPMEVEDNAFLALDLVNGGTAWLHASWTDWKNTFGFELCLETAKIDIRGLGGSYGPEQLTLYEMSPTMDPPTSTVFDWPSNDKSWNLEMVHFQNAIEGETPMNGATLDDAIYVHRLIEEAYSE